MDAKENLIETLHYYIFKLENNLCTPEEINSTNEILLSNIKINGSIEDFAKFYGVSPLNIRATIHRKLIAKPVRKVLYPFHLFQKVVPDKWRKRSSITSKPSDSQEESKKK